jgi:hypothetical protein
MFDQADTIEIVKIKEFTSMGSHADVQDLK